MPQRIQRKRIKGWRLPANAVSVTRPGRWGNPFAIGKDGDRAQVLRRFETYARDRMAKEPGWLEPLRGKDLACFCSEGEACHADMLLQFANAAPRRVVSDTPITGEDSGRLWRGGVSDGDRGNISHG
jgi:hypothetical protein